ncbi:N-acetyltransferase [Nocardioides sp. CFH 31398]|nr:GNAT family N-acetyltransferase [Nocardioides sp. CFH 31398]MCH1865644.1 N-acetyltransferase [Nocardioides sp. CFH 31398]
MPVVVQDVPDRSRYVVLADGRQAGLLTYDRGETQIDLLHTEVDDAYAGRGLAKALVTHALDAARRDGLAVVPSCPYVAEFLRRDPSYADLVPAARRAELGLD